MLQNFKLTRCFKNLLAVLAVFVIFSCNKNKSTELRFVNLEGKSKPIKFRVPEENAQILNNPKLASLPNPNLVATNNQNSKPTITPDTTDNTNINNNKNIDIAKNNPNNPQNLPPKTPNQNETPNNTSFNQQYSNNQQQSSKTIAEQKYDFAENVANSLVPNPNLAKKSNTEISEEIPEEMPEKMIIQGSYVNETKNIKEKEKFLDKSKKNNPKPVNKAENITKNTGEKQFYLQLGSFNNQENANDFINKSKNKNLQTIEANLGSKTVYRAVLGPYQNRKIALKEMQKIQKSGQEVVIIKN